MNGYHTAKINNYMFYVFSNDADYEYIVRVVYSEDLERAMQIAEETATRWGSADDDDPYYHMGYVEVVKDAFEQNGIEATYFTDCYE